MTVAMILKSKGSDVISVTPDDDIASAIQLLASKRIGAVLVLDVGKRLAGILSERDIVRAMASHGADALAHKVGSVMTSSVTHTNPRETIAHIMEKMTQGRFRHLPVLDDGVLVGIVSIGDVVKRRIDDAVHEAEALKEYVASAG